MLHDLLANISAEMKRDVCMRIKSLRSNYGVGKGVNIGWWLALESLVCFGWQAKAQDRTQLVEQYFNLGWFRANPQA